MKDTITELAASALNMTCRLPDGPLKSSARIFPFAAGGSNRYFFRLSDDSRSAVALIEPGGGKSFQAYVRIGTFLNRNGVAVPEFYAFDFIRGILIMEDLGDLSLEKTVKNNDSDGLIPLYRDCLDMLTYLQTSVTDKMRKDNILREKVFGEEQFLAETEYFETEFLSRFMPAEPPESWKEEKSRLARSLGAEEKVFMHRDFQSRNIIINNKEPRLIDFQTACRGPGIYDVASLLTDPYVILSESTVRILFDYYCQGMSGGNALNSRGCDRMLELFAMAGLQRNLQALAAFAKLGYGEGKKHFIRSIPSALQVLKREAENTASFPAVREIAFTVLEKISREQPPEMY